MDLKFVNSQLEQVRDLAQVAGILKAARISPHTEIELAPVRMGIPVALDCGDMSQLYWLEMMQDQTCRVCSGKIPKSQFKSIVD